MKTKTKALALVLSAVLLVVTTVFTTMAYLTSTTKTVQNTFTVGKVAITLDEAKVDEYGVEIEGAERVLKNEYKLIPGHTYVKDPTVTVAADSEESYIRMIVTISDFEDVQSVLGSDFLPQNFVNGWDEAVWVSTKKIKVEDNVATYEFRYKETVSTVDGAAKILPALFTEIVMLNSVSNNDLLKLEEMEINVVAHAIQADGFKTADEAWAAWGN